jgi:hypothetical protein
MKRALFKLGRHFVVESRSDSSSFVLDVDVDAWAEETASDWSFTLDELDESYDPSQGDGVGTSIAVDRLNPSVSEDFASSQTLANLRYQLRLRHREAMDRGLRILLQGEAVIPFEPKLQQSELVRPLYRTFTLEENPGPVMVRIYAGVAEHSGPEEDDQAEEFRRERDAGWYVFCNNRLLIAADRTTLTGWGDVLPGYHPQYRQFRGYVFIDSAYSELLGAEVVQMLNKVKAERQNAELPEDRPIAQALSQSRAVRLYEIKQTQKLTYPTPSRMVANKPAMRKIQYSIEKKKFDAVAEVLNVSTVAEVGRGTFDYFYAEQVGDDD